MSSIATRCERVWRRLTAATEALKRFLTRDAVRLEISSRCQLKCPSCPTAKGENRKGPVGWGNLTLAAFDRFVRDNPRIRQIEISNWGEIFLNPDLEDIMRHAHEAHIRLTAYNGVNFNAVRDTTLEALVKYGFRRLTIAIDGATPETYRKYRRGGDFGKVIANIEKLNDLKRRYRSRYPKLTWQFIIFGHNEHELPRARSMARSLGMRFSPRFNGDGWDPLYSPVKDRALVRRESGFGAASYAEYRERHGLDLVVPCHDMWLAPQINWDGKLLGCCLNVWGDFGNVFDSSLDECLGSEKYTYTQRMLLGEVPIRNDSPCAPCHLYRNHALERLVQSSLPLRVAGKLLSGRVATGNR
jgi:MoaA/NifB/PqqE/SkfB family radical SAM enzyme